MEHLWGAFNLTFIFICNGQTSDCSIQRMWPGVCCIDLDVGKRLWFVVCFVKDCRFIDQDGEGAFLSIKDLVHVYLGPLASRQDVGDLLRIAWVPIQRCGDTDPLRRMQVFCLRSWRTIRSQTLLWRDARPRRRIPPRSSADSPQPTFLAQSGDRRQVLVLGKLLFHWRREDRLPWRCKKYSKQPMAMLLI